MQSVDRKGEMGAQGVRRRQKGGPQAGGDRRRGQGEGDEGRRGSRVHQPKERLSCRLRAIPCQLLSAGSFFSTSLFPSGTFYTVAQTWRRPRESLPSSSTRRKQPLRRSRCPSTEGFSPSFPSHLSILPQFSDYNLSFLVFTLRPEVLRSSAATGQGMQIYRQQRFANGKKMFLGVQDGLDKVAIEREQADFILIPRDLYGRGVKGILYSLRARRE